MMGRLYRSIQAVVLICFVSFSANSFASESDQSQQTNSESNPATISLALIRHTRSVADGATMKTTAELADQSIAEKGDAITASTNEILRLINSLADAGYADVADRMRELLSELTENAAQLNANRLPLAHALRQSQQARSNLIASTDWELLPATLSSEDDLFYQIVSRQAESDDQIDETSANLSREELLLYTRLALLTQQVDQGYIALEVATRLPDHEFVGTVEENANLVMYQLRETVESLSAEEQANLDPTLVPLARDLIDSAYGDANLILLMKTRLQLTQQETNLANAVQDVSQALQLEAGSVFRSVVGELDNSKAILATLDLLDHLSSARSHWSQPTAANTSINEGATAIDPAAVHIDNIRENVEILQGLGYDAEPTGLNLLAPINDLASVASQIHSGRPELMKALQSAAQTRAELRSFIDYEVEPAVVASLDNQLYYMLTGRSEFRNSQQPGADPKSIEEFMRYRHLSLVYTSLFRTFSGLVIAVIMSDGTLIGEGEERYGTASHRLERSIDYLEKVGGVEIDPDLVPLSRRFMDFGRGENSVFDALKHRLPLIASEREAIEAGEKIHLSLQSTLEMLLEGTIQGAKSTSQNAD